MDSIVKMTQLYYNIWRYPHRSVERRKSIQTNRLHRLLRFARHHSPFLHNHWQSTAEEAPLSVYPPSHKTPLMANWEDWITDKNLSRKQIENFLNDPHNIGKQLPTGYSIWTSSGSTGVPGIYVHDKNACQVYQAIESMRCIAPRLFGSRWKEHWTKPFKLAVIIATEGHFAGIAWVLSAKEKHPWLKERLRVFSVMTPIDELVHALNEFQPGYVLGYATVLDVLASEQNSRALAISPRAIIPSGETPDFPTQS